MLLCILAANNWQLRTIDIKSAYLQGCPISRDLYILPPECAKTDKLWKLIKTPYGLVDAGRKWYIRVMKEFTALGAHQAKCDQAVYIWSDPSGQGPCGILVAHVGRLSVRRKWLFPHSSSTTDSENVHHRCRRNTKLEILGFISQTDFWIHHLVQWWICWKYLRNWYAEYWDW